MKFPNRPLSMGLSCCFGPSDVSSAHAHPTPNLYPNGAHRRQRPSGRRRLSSRHLQRPRRTISPHPPRPARQLPPQSPHRTKSPGPTRRRRQRPGQWPLRHDPRRRWRLERHHSPGRPRLPLLLVPHRRCPRQRSGQRDLFRLGKTNQRRGNPRKRRRFL